MGEVSRACAVNGCGRPVRGRGWCQSHYMRWYMTGDVRADEPLRPTGDPSPVSLVGGGVAEVTLGDGSVALVSACDAERVGRHRWQHHGRGYVKSRQVGFLHRFVLDAPDGTSVDHINGNPRDNRRENLRLATHQQNGANMRKRPGSSRFKGVSLDRRRGVWVARIMVDGRTIDLGRHSDELEAALAYDRAAERFFGRFAATNDRLGLLPADLRRAAS